MQRLVQKERVEFYLNNQTKFKPVRHDSKSLDNFMDQQSYLGLCAWGCQYILKHFEILR